MLWSSISLMTLIDISIIGIVFILYFGYWRNRQMLDRIEVKFPIRLILIGLFSAVLLHIADLYIMFSNLLYSTHAHTIEAITILHLNIGWIEELVIVGSVGIGMSFFLNLFLPRIVSIFEMRISDLETITEITKAANSSFEPEKIFREIILRVRRVIPCEWLLIASHDNGIWTNWHYESEFHGIIDDESNFFGSSTWVQEVYAKEELVNIPNLLELKSSARPKMLSESGFKSILSIPILQDGSLVAHFSLASTKPAAFTTEHENFLNSISDHLGAVIRNAILYKKAEERGVRFAILNKLSRQIAQNLEEKDILQRIAQSTMELMRGCKSRIFLFDETLNGFKLCASYGLVPDEEFQAPQFGKGLIGTVAKERKPLIVGDILKDSRWLNIEWAKKYDLHSYIAFPFEVKGSHILVINCFSNKRNYFTENDLDLLGALAHQAGIAMKNAILHRKEQSSKEFFQRIMDDNADAMLVSDSSGRIVRWNKAAEKLFGYREKEIQGRTIDCLIPDDCIDDKNFGRKARTYGEKAVFDSYRLKKDGTRFPVNISISPVRNDQDDWVICTIYKDLSDRIKQEMALRLAKQEAEAASQAKSEFLSNMSHELRSPLNAVIGFSDLLLMEADQNSELANHLIPKIRDSGKYLLTMIEELLDLDRIAEGKVTLKPEPIFLNDLILRIIDSWLPRLPQGFSLKQQLDHGTGILNCDTVRISQVLNNLIDNAVKYSPNGGEILLRTIASNEHVQVCIQDQGMGISGEEKQWIFNRFAQLESGYTRRAGGLGIGLALARKVMEMHGGHITVESEKGMGSTFTITIPRVHVPNGETEKEDRN